MSVPKITGHGRGRQLAALVVMALGQAAAAAVSAFATRELFSLLHGGGPPSWKFLAALAGAGIAMCGLRIGFRSKAEQVGQDYARDVRLALFDHASRMWPRQLAARRVGLMSLRFVGDMTALKDWPAIGLPRLVEGAVMLPAAAAVLFVLNPDFGWIGMAIVAVALAALALSARGLAAAHRKVRARRARLAADLAERMPIAADLASLGRRRDEAALVKRRADNLKQAAVARTRRAESLHALPEALTGIAAAAIIWRGAALGLPAGTIAAGLAALGLAARPLRDFMGVANRAAAFRAAHRKLVESLSRPIAPVRPVEGVRLQPGPLALQLRDAVVGGGEPLSFSLLRGERGNLPDGTDAGALFRAIAGQEPLQAGEMLLEGTPVESLSPGSLRRGVALITDSPIVLRGSLRRALTLGLMDRPKDEQIRKRIEKAGLTAVLESMGSFDRRLREGARTFSRGERVKLSLLRAALCKPGLILIAPGIDIDDGEARDWFERHSATVLWAKPAAKPLRLIAPIKGAA